MEAQVRQTCNETHLIIGIYGKSSISELVTVDRHISQNLELWEEKYFRTGNWEEKYLRTGNYK